MTPVYLHSHHRVASQEDPSPDGWRVERNGHFVPPLGWGRWYGPGVGVGEEIVFLKTED